MTSYSFLVIDYALFKLISFFVVFTKVSGENSFPVFQDENAHSRIPQGKPFGIPSAGAAPAFSIHVDTTSSYVQSSTSTIKSTDKENEHILLDTALSLPVPQAQRIPLRTFPDVEDNNVSLNEESLTSSGNLRRNIGQRF